jgi:hypothetical protein
VKRYDLVDLRAPQHLDQIYSIWGEKRYELVYSAQGPVTLGPDVWGEKRYELV